MSSSHLFPLDAVLRTELYRFIDTAFVVKIEVADLDITAAFRKFKNVRCDLQAAAAL